MPSKPSQGIFHIPKRTGDLLERLADSHFTNTWLHTANQLVLDILRHFLMFLLPILAVWELGAALVSRNLLVYNASW
jgi:hypothetical protein